MNKTKSEIDKSFKKWLQQISKKWKLSVEETAIWISIDEIDNRESEYPKIQQALKEKPINYGLFLEGIRKSWALGNQFDGIKFNIFTHNKPKAIKVISDLITKFPSIDSGAIKRINDFVDRAVLNGYQTNTGSSDYAGAALLASIILTSIYPERFVDFRTARWEKFARYFDYDLSADREYGSLLVWAGNFGKLIVNTPTFKKYWSQENTLWTISGISWDWPDPVKPKNIKLNPKDIKDIKDEGSFPEGKKKEKMHIYYERNRKVIDLAKAYGKAQDPSLPCQVCGFSYVGKYGELGRNFIEAHHKVPIAELRHKKKETFIKDIALLCANCHRMIHTGEKTLSIEALKKEMNS